MHCFKASLLLAISAALVAAEGDKITGELYPKNDTTCDKSVSGVVNIVEGVCIDTSNSRSAKAIVSGACALYMSPDCSGAPYQVASGTAGVCYTVAEFGIPKSAKCASA